MDGRQLSGILKKKGLKAIQKHSTRIRGYCNYSKGDYRIYTERAFDIYNWPDGQPYKGRYVRKVECNSDNVEIVKGILLEMNEPILSEFNNELTLSSY